MIIYMHAADCNGIMGSIKTKTVYRLQYIQFRISVQAQQMIPVQCNKVMTDARSFILQVMPRLHCHVVHALCMISRHLTEQCKIPRHLKELVVHDIQETTGAAQDIQALTRVMPDIQTHDIIVQEPCMNSHYKLYMKLR